MILKTLYLPPLSRMSKHAAYWVLGACKTDSFRKILTQLLEGDDLPEYGIAAVLGDESCLRLEDESWLN